MKEDNKKALQMMNDGLFEECQQLLRKNCKSGDYRSFHNLGCFYCENGLTQKNHKTVSGYSYGKHYIEKANRVRENSLSCMMLAQFLYEYEHNYSKALEMYQKSLQLHYDDDVQYNIACCLFKLKKYSEVMPPIVNSIKRKDEIILYCFSLLNTDYSAFAEYVSNYVLACIESFTLDLQILLLYYYDITMISEDIIEQFLLEWCPDEYMWAILIDIWVSQQNSVDQIKQRIKENVVDYKNGNQAYRKIYSLITTPIQRQSIILSASYYQPIIRKKCGFFGCEVHHTRW